MQPLESAGSRRALFAAALLFLALALFGQRYHWVEEAGTAERDGYVAQAEQILHGSLPHDPFRPLLYPLLTAGLSLVVRDPFLAARLLSNLAAASLAWLAWATGRRLAGPATGAWAMALLAVNPNLWILGQHVTTDMLFAALGAAALLCGLIYLESPAPGPALGAGLAFGLLLGIGIFVATNLLVLKGGPRVGQHLNLLRVFLPGYKVTFLGSLIGFVYAFVFGYALGRLIGTVYNWLVRDTRKA